MTSQLRALLAVVTAGVLGVLLILAIAPTAEELGLDAPRFEAAR